MMGSLEYKVNVAENTFGQTDHFLLPEQPGGWSHQAEMSSVEHVPRFTASMLSKHDCKALLARDPYFPQADSRLHAESRDTPGRGTSREWQEWQPVSVTYSVDTAA